MFQASLFHGLKCYLYFKSFDYGVKFERSAFCWHKIFTFIFIVSLDLKSIIWLYEPQSSYSLWHNPNAASGENCGMVFF